MPKRLSFLRKIILMRQHNSINDRKPNDDSESLNIRKVIFVRIGIFWLDFCTVRRSGDRSTIFTCVNSAYREVICGVMASTTSLSTFCSLLLTLLKASSIHMTHTYLQVRYRGDGWEGIFP